MPDYKVGGARLIDRMVDFSLGFAKQNRVLDQHYDRDLRFYEKLIQHNAAIGDLVDLKALIPPRFQAREATLTTDVTTTSRRSSTADVSVSLLAVPLTSFLRIRHSVTEDETMRIGMDLKSVHVPPGHDDK